MKRFIIFLIFVVFSTFYAYSDENEPAIAYKNIKGKWFVLDRKGNTIFTSDSIVDIYSFKEGLIKVKIKDGGQIRWAFLNSKGNILFKLDYDIVGDFCDGLAVVANYTDSTRTAGKFGYINKRGKLEIPMIYDEALSFSEGLAYVMNNEKRGYIDRKGEMVIALENAVGYFFKNGVTAISNMRYKVGYMNKRGELVVDFKFDDPVDFSEGFACVASEEAYGYIDTTGEFVIKPEYRDCKPFNQGLAWVAKLNEKYELKWGVIDRFGKVLIEFDFDDALPFYEGMAAVKKDKKWYYIRVDGEKAFDKDFDIVSNYKYGLTFAGNARKKLFGMLDKAGNFVWKINNPVSIVDLRFNKRLM